jgi:NADH-quinone oxidoreductase subunit C
MPDASLNLEKLKAQFHEDILSLDSPLGDVTIVIRAAAIVAVASFLKTDPDLQYNYLMDLSAVDCLRLGTPHRFEVVYHLFSLSSKQRIRIKVPLDGRNPELESLTCLWPGANWYEREAWDMFGIKFKNHPELKRILLYEEFEGHPLRKDYPINKRQPLIGPGSKEQTPV